MHWAFYHRDLIYTLSCSGQVSVCKCYFDLSDKSIWVFDSVQNLSKFPLWSWLHFILFHYYITYLHVPFRHVPFCLTMIFCTYSLFHLLQNCLSKYCTLCHRFCAYKYPLTNCPGGGRAVEPFFVTRWFGVIGSKLFGSLRLSVVRGRLFTSAAASYKKVLREESVSRPGARDNVALSTDLTVRICRSHIPPALSSKLLPWNCSDLCRRDPSFTHDEGTVNLFDFVYEYEIRTLSIACGACIRKVMYFSFHYISKICRYITSVYLHLFQIVKISYPALPPWSSSSSSS